MKIFERYLHGTGEEQPLPATRAKAFFYYGREYFGRLVLSSLTGSLFFLPALIWLYVMHYAEAKTISAPDATAPDYAEVLLALQKRFALTTYGVLIPLLALFFVGLAGCFSLAKRISMGESAGFSEFWRGIRQNGWRYFLFGAVSGSVCLVVRMNLLAYRGRPGFLSGLLVFCAALLFIVTVLILLYCMTQTVIYRVGVKQLLKNAVLLSFGRFFRNVGTLLPPALPVIAVLFIPSPFQLIGLAILAIFYPGFGALYAINCGLSVYDTTINPMLGEEYVGRGLAKKTNKTQEL